MRKMTVVALLAAAMLTSTGCVSRAIKEGIGTARGAKGFSAPVTGTANIAPGGLAGQYTTVVLEDFTEGPATQTPSILNGLVRGALSEQLAKTALPQMEATAGNMALIIRGKYLYYEKSGVAGQLFGPFEEVIVRVHLIDAKTGKTITVANCIGRTTTSVNKGIEGKAEGLAKGIVDLLNKSFIAEQ